MRFSLIICTYMRPSVVLRLLNSVKDQELYPDEIIIVDGSRDAKTKQVFEETVFKNLQYYKVEEKDRGLTKQRNFGISKVHDTMDIVCFLDDDIVLEKTYFKELIGTYLEYPEAGGVGGYITNEVNWEKLEKGEKPTYEEYEIDGYVRHLGSRNVLRKKLGLMSDKAPCHMPEFSNGFSVGYLPPNNKIYKAEYFMGGVSSFKKEVVDEIKFSTYFEGYGLYEDLEYCLRVSRKYKLYVNTAARLGHYHEEGGRPNKYEYGKMVTRNGWYVWRVGVEKPSLKARIKWNIIVFLQICIRLINTATTNKKKEAFSEALGRFIGWFTLIFATPKKKD